MAIYRSYGGKERSRRGEEREEVGSEGGIIGSEGKPGGVGRFIEPKDTSNEHREGSGEEGTGLVGGVAAKERGSGGDGGGWGGGENNGGEVLGTILRIHGVKRSDHQA